MKSVKTLIFGGAFDPVHEEHLKIAEAAIEELGLLRLIFMPTADSPHKTTVAPYAHRVEMLRISGLPTGSEISLLEKGRTDKNYTVDALDRWHAEFGDFGLLIGGDSLRDLHTWKNPEEIIAKVPLVVAERVGVDLSDVKAEWEKKGAKITMLKYRPTGISSTQMREELKKENQVKIANSPIHQEIQSNSPQMLVKLSTELDEEKYEHVKSVAVYACSINGALELGLNQVDVWTAGLLHDCKKQIKCYREQIPKLALDTAVEHQYASAIAARVEYGVDSQAVIDAIECHCTGKPNMSLLDKLIYVADKIEPTRAYYGVEQLRNLVMQDFEAGFLAVLKDQKRVIDEKGLENAYPLSQKTYEYYNKN